MDIFTDAISKENNIHTQTIRSILMGVALSVFVVMGVIVYFYYQSGLKTEMIIMGVSMIPILAALELARGNHTEIAATILAAVLTCMVTLLATVGQGIMMLG
jgi:hypothetical protein